jgi:hypothetical protein
LILSWSLTYAAIGIAIAVPTAAVLVRAVESQLAGVAPSGTPIFSVAIGVVPAPPVDAFLGCQQVTPSRRNQAIAPTLMAA